MDPWPERIRRLQAGETVRCRVHGNSMSPRLKSGDEVFLESACDRDTFFIRKGDVVLCKVKGRYYVHLVKHARPDAYTIANNHGHVNGVIKRNAIFGRVARAGEGLPS